MEWLSRQNIKLIAEMSVGVVLYNLLLCVLAFFLMPYLNKPLMPVIGGILIGMVCAIAMLVHMGVTMERVLDSQNESYANKNTVIQSLLRKLIYVAVLLAVWRWWQFSLLAVVFGTMGMKAGAYLQPWVHKFFERRSEAS